MQKKTLICDIETSLMDVVTFYIGRKVSISSKQIMKPSKIICIAYKWLGEKQTHCLTFDMEKDCHKQLLKDFIDLAEQADEVIAYNGDNFDIKWIAGAAALEGIKKPWPWNLTTDPLKQYRRSFRFPSNRLGDIASTLGLGHKDPMSIEDWIGIRNGCNKSLKKMVKYCKKDVELLEKIMLRLDKYTRKTVRELGIAHKGHSPRPSQCGKCDANSWVRHGMRAGMQRWRCNSCGSVTKT